jgi:glycosyltransferase involved in cell wall biosynthesis
MGIFFDSLLGIIDRVPGALSRTAGL